MRIAESTVALSAKHEAERSQTTDISLEHSFRKVFESLATGETEHPSELRQRISKLLAITD